MSGQRKYKQFTRFRVLNITINIPIGFTSVAAAADAPETTCQFLPEPQSNTVLGLFLRQALSKCLWSKSRSSSIQFYKSVGYDSDNYGLTERKL